MKYTIAFAPIDCKCSGYTPLFFEERVEGHKYPEPTRDMATINAKILMEANQEYMTRLSQLQKEIKDKYEPHLKDLPPSPNDDYYHGLSKLEYDGHKKFIQSLYPGKWAPWYD